MKVSEALEVAKQKIINKDNWWDGKGYNPIEGQCCMITALTDSYQECRILLRQAIKELDLTLKDVDVEDIVVSHWNDAHSHEEVIQVYDKAIELAKASEV